jgi:prophage tail gpP-like protein
MAHRYITTNADGTIAITGIAHDDPDGVMLTKTLFELSRTTDRTTHFDPAVHTLVAIAAGISGHRALALTAECEDTDLPSDRYFRNAWEWSD